MEPELAIVSPKPKSYTNYSVRKSHLSRLLIENIRETDHPNSTKNLIKNQANKKNNFLDFNENLTISTKNTACDFKDVLQAEKKSARKDLKLNFFEECENELDRQECQGEIFSILSDFNEKSSQKESYTNSNTSVSCILGNYFENNKDFKDFDGENCFFRSSLPPSRPRNPFFKNFNDNNDREINEFLDDNLKKGISEDFLNGKINVEA